MPQVRSLDDVKPTTTSAIIKGWFLKSTEFDPPAGIKLQLTLIEKIIKRNKTIFDQLPYLDSGWDGYNGQKFDIELIKTVKKAVDSAKYPPKVFPGSDGIIQLEYFTDDNNNVEIEVAANNITVIECLDGTEKVAEFQISELNTLIETYGRPQSSRNHR